MNKVMQGFSELWDKWGSAIPTVIILALVVVGIMLLIPSKKTKDEAKSHLPWILIGVAVIGGAAILANEIWSSFN